MTWPNKQLEKPPIPTRILICRIKLGKPTFGLFTVIRLMSFKCPNCKVKIYSRAHRRCRACGFDLAAELLLPKSQIRYHEEKMEREKRAMLEADKNVSRKGPGVGAPGAFL